MSNPPSPPLSARTWPKLSISVDDTSTLDESKITAAKLANDVDRHILLNTLDLRAGDAQDSASSSSSLASTTSSGAWSQGIGSSPQPSTPQSVDKPTTRIAKHNVSWFVTASPCKLGIFGASALALTVGCSVGAALLTGGPAAACIIGVSVGAAALLYGVVQLALHADERFVARDFGRQSVALLEKLHAEEDRNPLTRFIRAHHSKAVRRHLVGALDDASAEQRRTVAKLHTDAKGGMVFDWPCSTGAAALVSRLQNYDEGVLHCIDVLDRRIKALPEVQSEAFLLALAGALKDDELCHGLAMAELTVAVNAMEADKYRLYSYFEADAAALIIKLLATSSAARENIGALTDIVRTVPKSAVRQLAARLLRLPERERWAKLDSTKLRVLFDLKN